MRFVRDERGQSLIMTAVSLTALLGFCGLAADVGALFHAQRQLQIAADAGATAAAMAMSRCELRPYTHQAAAGFCRITSPLRNAAARVSPSSGESKLSSCSIEST